VLCSLWANLGQPAAAHGIAERIRANSSVSASPSASSSPVPAAFAFHGAGFGHGIGLSQYGAQGMATDGATSDEIIEHYFPGASLTPMPMPSNLIVGLLQDRTSDKRRFISMRSESVGGRGKGLTVMLGNSKISVLPKKVITFAVINNQIVAYGPNGIYQDSKKKNISATTANITWGKQVQGSKVSTVVNVASADLSATATTNLGDSCAFNNCSHRYKYGSLTISPYAGGTLNITNTLRLTDEYLYGLGEMPSAWKPAALEAQAIAGRSYAYIKYQAKPDAPYRSQCACQIYATTVDQNFVGFAKEFATAGSNWAAAVDATDTKVAAYNGRVIETFFSSSTGGYTQPLAEAWGTSGYPWLTKVDDHWSTASPNPNANWTRTLSQANLVGKLRAAGVNVKDVATFSVTGHYESGAVSELSTVDSAGRVTAISVIPTILRPAAPNISPSGLRSIFGLKSTYVKFISPSARKVPGASGNTPDVLQILNVRKWPATVGLPRTDFTLSGDIKPVQMGVTLVLSDFVNGKWTSVARTKSDIAGHWQLDYLAAPVGEHKLKIVAKNSVSTIRAYSLPIVLSSKITLLARAHNKRAGSSTMLSGELEPATKSITVYLLRKYPRQGWKFITKTHTDSLGRFNFLTKVGAKKWDVSYRVKASSSMLGSATSDPVIITVK
jgi:SpoIID/LytB domain protein